MRAQAHARQGALARLSMSVAAALLLTGCAVSDDARTRGVSTVSAIVLERPLDLPRGDARVYVQDGEVIRQGERNRFEPYCSFAVRKRSGDEALVDTIRPGRFLASEPIEGAQPESSPPGIHGASLAFGWIAVDRDRGTPGLYTWYTQYRLRSDEQPQVDRMTCARDADSLDGNLTLGRIRATLAGVATIETYD